MRAPRLCITLRGGGFSKFEIQTDYSSYKNLAGPNQETVASSLTVIFSDLLACRMCGPVGTASYSDCHWHRSVTLEEVAILKQDNYVITSTNNTF